jgi:hypothetical protein
MCDLSAGFVISRIRSLLKMMGDQPLNRATPDNFRHPEKRELDVALASIKYITQIIDVIKTYTAELLSIKAKAKELDQPQLKPRR